jgi:hypothetical protein
MPCDMSRLSEQKSRFIWWRNKGMNQVPCINTSIIAPHHSFNLTFLALQHLQSDVTAIYRVSYSASKNSWPPPELWTVLWLVKNRSPGMSAGLWLNNTAAYTILCCTVIISQVSAYCFSPISSAVHRPCLIYHLHLKGTEEPMISSYVTWMRFLFCFWVREHFRNFKLSKLFETNL